MIIEDTGEGLIKYDNGALLSFYAINNYLCDEPIETRLYCENGVAIFSYDNAVVSLNNGSQETMKKLSAKACFLFVR